MSLTGTLLWLLLVILRPVTRKLFSASWHYRTCVLAVLFLLLPVSVFAGPAISAALNNSGSELPQIASTLTEMISAPEEGAPPSASHAQTKSPLQQTAANAETTQTTTEAVNTSVSQAVSDDFSALDILPYLPYLWAAGAVLFVAVQAIKHMRFARKLSRTNLPVEDAEILALLDDAMRDMNLPRKVVLMSSSVITTPMLTGLFKSVLILPEIEMTNAELRMVFRHELTHLKRRDIYIKLLTLIANAVHWFNPAAYRLRRALDTFCELSCDERVVSDMNPEERRFYGETILNVLCRVTKRREGLFAAFAATRRGFEKRLLRIMDFKKASKRAAAFSLSLLLLLGLIGCAAGGLAGAKMEQTKELTICVDPWAQKYLQRVINRFMIENREVKVNLTILPDIFQGTEYKPEERELALSQLRTQVMAGTGPDLFILQSDPIMRLPALFQDVEKAMRGGVFCDVLPLFRQAEISMDDFIAPVMAAGQVNGKQYIVPLRYQVYGVMTNDLTRNILGDQAFKSPAAMLEGIRAMAEVPGMGPVFSHSWEYLNELCRDPFYPMNPQPVDYDAQTAHVDTPLLRDILKTCKSVFEKKSVTADEKQLEISQGYWKDYARTDAYFAFFGCLDEMATEAYLSEKQAGLAPHLDAFPTEDGGASANITLYAGIRANSANKLNAVNLLNMLLSAEYQTKPHEMMTWDFGWPVRKGVLEEYLKTYMNEGKFSLISITDGQYNGWTTNLYFEAPLTEESVNNFLAVEAKITSAGFPPPEEIFRILIDYWYDKLDLDTTIIRMQDYWDKSLTE